MLNHYRLTMPMFDAEVEKTLSRQCLDPTLPYYGVTPDFAKGYCEPTMGCGNAALLMTAYYNPDAARYHDPLLLERAAMAMDYTLSMVHEDGSIDLMETNFHDATLNGFALHNLGPAVLVMQRDSEHTPAEEALMEKCLSFVRSSADAMVNLGFHTPNHRWVTSASLAYCWRITGDERCRRKIDDFLAEGVDCDENGEYTERSAGIYNCTCNQTLMIMADQLCMPELRAHVARNLRLAPVYFEPDDTVNTLNSTRQDMGRAPDRRVYYSNYLTAALEDGDGKFAYYADEMLKKTLGQFQYGAGYTGVPQMSLFLLHPEWEERFAQITPVRPETDFERLMPDTGILRKRQGDLTLTLIKDRPLFCRVQAGSHLLTLRYAGSFFGNGQFQPQTLEAMEDGGYRMTMVKRAGYKRPLNPPPASPMWKDMDHSKRETVAVQEYRVTVEVHLENRILTVRTRTEGCDNIPVKLELMLQPGGMLDVGTAEFFTRAGDYIFLRSGETTYTYSDFSRITVRGAFQAHNYGSNMRGAQPGDGGSLTLAMTAFSPSDETVTVQF